jgi:hypothetical protein
MLGFVVKIGCFQSRLLVFQPEKAPTLEQATGPNSKLSPFRSLAALSPDMDLRWTQREEAMKVNK